MAMERQRKPDSNLVWAILCTFFCCLPLGIVSLIYAIKAECNSSDNIEEIQDDADKAMKYAKIGAIVGGICITLYILLYIVLFGFIIYKT